MDRVTSELGVEIAQDLETPKCSSIWMYRAPKDISIFKDIAQEKCGFESIIKKRGHHG